MISKTVFIAIFGCIQFNFVVGKSPSLVIDRHQIPNPKSFESVIVADGFAPELKPPKGMYNSAVEIGAAKVDLSPLKILLLGIMSGCHISFGT